ncbi:MAG: ROK family protein [Bacteroidales bacterium]
MEKPYVIGIDMGGTGTKFGIVDTKGTILGQGSIATPDYPEINDYIDALYEGLLPLIEEVGGFSQIRGIGIGAPNGNFYKSSIEFAPNLPWKGVIQLGDLLKAKFQLPSAVTNDANAAAIGEMTYGVARGMKNFIIITLGTGVGSGIVINGDLVYGHDGFAGELGHTTIRRTNGRLCGCGKKGCLETYASATGVARTAREIIETSDEKSSLRSLDIDKITSKDVYDAAIAGDSVAAEIFRTTGNILGEAFADFVAFSAPEAIVVFGGLAQAGELIMKPIREGLDNNVLPLWRGKIKVLPSELKASDAAILGAGALGWEAK